MRTLRAAVPSTPDLGEFILQANDIATASGIDWLSISPSPPAATGGGGPTSTIAVSIQIQGGFFEVLDYLNRLEDLERLVIVDTINISAAAPTRGPAAPGPAGSIGGSTDSSGAPDLSVTLTGRMFTDAAADGVARGARARPTTPSTPGATTPTTPGATTPTTPPASSSGSSS